MQICNREIGSLRMEGEKLIGVAAVYNAPSKTITEFGETFREVILPGALSAEDNISFVVRHNEDAIMGDTASGTLRLHDTPTALEFSLDLPAYASRLRSLVESGKIKGMSIRFTKDEFTRGPGLHTVTKGTLMHVAAVEHPAYPQTQLTVSRNSSKTLRQKLLIREYIIP